MLPHAPAGAEAVPPPFVSAHTQDKLVLGVVCSGESSFGARNFSIAERFSSSSTFYGRWTVKFGKIFFGCELRHKSGGVPGSTFQLRTRGAPISDCPAPRWCLRRQTRRCRRSR